MLQISSVQNPRIKNLVKLAKRRERDRQRVTLVEGLREIRHALAANIQPLEVYVCPDLLEPEATALLQQLQGTVTNPPICFIEVTTTIFDKVAYRGNSGGLLLVIPYLNQPLEQLALSPNPFLILMEGVEKPGNLGAILRTADAAGVDAVIVCAGATDIHNPNVIRASLGALFTLPIVEVTTDALIEWLRQYSIQIVAADPAATLYHMQADLRGPIAIVMGSEARGLTADWLATANTVVKIPMAGAVDSLNLSAATAIMLYEIVRQRMQNG